MKNLPKKIGALRVKGINPDWNDPKYINPPSTEPKKLRNWQPKGFKALKNKRFTFPIAPCGSGKTVFLIALSIDDVVRSEYKQKQLIVVPQSHIGRGFVSDGDLSYVSIVVNGKTYEWKVLHDFCDDKNHDVLEKLKKWLLRDGKSLSKNYRGNVIAGLNAVTSHMALGIVWNGLTAAQKKIAIKNLTLRVDEAHHVDGIFDIDENELNGGLSEIEKYMIEQESTNLGTICRYIFNSKNRSSKICLATATPYRGDKAIILSKAAMKKFHIYHVDWIEHFKTLGIEEFYLEYEEYIGDPIDQIVAKMAFEPNEKHMVVIPSTTRKWRQNGKDELVQLLSEIYKIVPKERVLDLVTQSTQARNKELLLAEPSTPDSGESKFDVVITCMLGREGTDWCPCSRVHNGAPEGSTTLAMQTIGRPFRRFEGKTKVRIYYYVHQFPQPKKGMTKRELFSDRTNCLIYCLQLDDMYNPIMVTVIPNGKKGKRTKGQSATSVPLSDIFGDQYQTMKIDLIEEIECLEEKTSKEIDSVIEDVLDKYGIEDADDGVKDALRALSLRMISHKLRDLGIDVSFIREEGFDKIIEKHGIKNMSIFFGSYNKKDWKIIRDIVKHSFLDNVAKIKEIGIENVKEQDKDLYRFMLRYRRICNRA